MAKGFQDSQFSIPVMNDSLLKLNSNRGKFEFLLDYKSKFVQKYGIPNKPQTDSLFVTGDEYYWVTLSRFYDIICVELEKYKDNTPEIPVNKNFPFDNRFIETIIFPDKLEAFYNIEKQLFEKKYLSSEGKWIALKPLLVAFIHILIELKYVKPIINGKSKDNSLNHVRQYFENRYLTDITQQMKPSRFDLKKLHTYHPDFIYIIPEIDSIKK